MEYAERGRAAGDLAGKEYGSGVVARLGGEGAAAAGRSRGDRRELRAHPPLEPGGHGHPAAAIPAPGRSAETLGITGEEIFHVGDAPGCLQAMLDSKFAGGRILPILAENGRGKTIEFSATLRIDTPQEILYYQHGGILQYVLRQLAAKP